MPKTKTETSHTKNESHDPYNINGPSSTKNDNLNTINSDDFNMKNKKSLLLKESEVMALSQTNQADDSSFEIDKAIPVSNKFEILNKHKEVEICNVSNKRLKLTSKNNPIKPTPIDNIMDVETIDDLNDQHMKLTQRLKQIEENYKKQMNEVQDELKNLNNLRKNTPSTSKTQSYYSLDKKQLEHDSSQISKSQAVTTKKKTTTKSNSILPMTANITNQDERPVKLPAIISYNINNKNLRELLLKEMEQKDFVLKNVNSNVTQVIVYNLNNFNRVKVILKEHEKHFFSFTPKGLKPISILLRNLDRTFDESDIIEGINELKLDNVKVEKIYKFKTNNSTKKKIDLNLWAIQLTPDSNVSELMKVDLLLNTKINFERIKNTRVMQCKNCQRFGHLAVNCSMPYRCVKCADSHLPGQCPLDSEDNSQSILKCANCGNEHTSNYGGCPRFREVLNKSKNLNIQNKNKHAPQGKVISNMVSNRFPMVRSGFSYANAVSGHNPSPSGREKNSTNDNTDFNFLNGEVNRLFNKNINVLLKSIKEFLPSYTNLSNDEDKKLMLLQFMFNISII